MNNPPLLGKTACLMLCLTAALGCRQEMARQPSYRPWAPSEFFADGRADRPPEAGTVARGQLQDDALFHEGRGPNASSAASLTALGGDPWLAVALALGAVDEPTDRFPFAVTEEVLHHGRQRFNIYCAPCHGRLGNGNGRIVQRGYVQPPTFHKAKWREAPDGRIFQIITQGKGAMPSYAAQIPPVDRWAIIAYLRALQLSQNALADDLPAEARRQLEGGQ